MTPYVALYAAVVASAAVVWQVYQWKHSHKLRVEVTARLGMVGLLTGPQDVVTVWATNRSDYPIRITGVGFVSQHESSGRLSLIAPMNGSTIPGVVAPHDAGTTYFDQHELARDIDFEKPLVAFVRLATGEEIFSIASVL